MVSIRIIEIIIADRKYWKLIGRLPYLYFLLRLSFGCSFFGEHAF